MTAPQNRSFNVTGAGISLVGAVLLVLGFYVLDWYSIQGQKLDYSDFHDAAKLPNAPGWGDAYFTWLGMALLIAVIVVALAANAGFGASMVLGPLGLLLGLGGAIGGILALRQAFDPDSEAFKHTSIGLWLWLVGFVIAGIGAIAGSMSRS